MFPKTMIYDINYLERNGRVKSMSPRKRSIFIVLFSFFVGGLASYFVDWYPLYEAILAACVTVAVMTILLLVMPKGS